MKVDDVIYVRKKGEDRVQEATVVGLSPRFFGERRKDNRAVKDTHIIQICTTGELVLDLHCDVFTISQALKEGLIGMNRKPIEYKGKTFYWKCFWADGSYYENDSHFAFTDKVGQVSFSSVLPNHQIENR